ncbi:probable protein phosphatase 2C 7 [Lotus japonicus]|uniref:probable protein phosphatase 2C 7 n=1 Tax=Lotus japonicus TaxID=34305 RepID=UPI002584E09B|nr:probable protein phosphatase 2C 7 [Lotus japonicus]
MLFLLLFNQLRCSRPSQPSPRAPPFTAISTLASHPHSEESSDERRGFRKIVGPTAVVVVVCSSHIIISNCGDSRAILYRGKEPITLSADHKPNREDEYARIEAAGGKVIQWNGHRIFGVLAMSRSIVNKLYFDRGVMVWCLLSKKTLSIEYGHAISFSFLMLAFGGNVSKVNMSIAILPMSAEYNWSPSAVGLIQSSFFWGYLLTQV